MNTEEKAKAYDEALELMRDCVPDENGLVHVRPSEIFTELQESEDERIKKTLIDYFKNYKTQEEIGIKTFFGISTDDIIAWLEKQGQRPQTTWKPSNEQIIALRWVLNNIPYNKHKEEISGLLEQIKKL